MGWQRSGGLRWNGDEGSGVGQPQSRVVATWFILPEEIADAVLEAATRLESGKDLAVMQGYREMAADRDREAEAEEWSEVMIGDGVEAR